MCWPSSILRALGEVGVAGVERLGHHEPEHRVAEELEALVGGETAVLVGVRAVRQGALKELGFQRGVPERLSQCLSAQRTCLCSLKGPGAVRRGRRTGRTFRTRGAWNRSRR